MDLSVNDRVVRTTFRQCRTEDAEIRNAFQLAFGLVIGIDTEVDNSVEVREFRDHWSEFLANRGFLIRDGDSIERYCAALKGNSGCGP